LIFFVQYVRCSCFAETTKILWEQTEGAESPQRLLAVYRGSQLRYQQIFLRRHFWSHGCEHSTFLFFFFYIIFKKKKIFTIELHLLVMLCLCGEQWTNLLHWVWTVFIFSSGISMSTQMFVFLAHLWLQDILQGRVDRISWVCLFNTNWNSIYCIYFFL
jgi:hypothetical protein